MTIESSPTPEDEPSLPDDVWEQFARDSERAIRASAPKEPSARARMVARRLREEDERLAPETRRRPRRRGRGRGTAPAAEPTAWRSGTTDAGERRLRRRNRIKAGIAVVLVALLVLIALSPSHAWSLMTGKG